MPNENDSIDLQRLIAEVAARHNLFLKPDDPAIALVTMNQLILDDAMEAVHEQIRETIAEFHASMQKAEKRAGNMLAQIVKESAAQMQRGLQNDIHIAGLKAREIVHLVNEAHRRPALIRWSAVGLVAGALLSAAVFGLGLAALAQFERLDMWILVLLLNLLGRKNFLRFLAGWMLIMLFFLYCFVHEAFDQPRPTQRAMIRTSQRPTRRARAGVRLRALTSALDGCQRLLDGSFDVFVLPPLVPFVRQIA